MLQHALSLASVCSLVLVSCAGTPSASDEHEMLARYDAQHRAELEAFEREQADFLRRTPVPERSEFSGLGTLILNERELLGRPGKAFVRVRFTYVNSTGRMLDAVRATLYLHDPETGEGWGETLLMRVPYKYHLTPDSTYTSWIDTPTKGVEFKPGWTWELVLEPVD